MHFSAKRGLAIACRPSVCPSVTLVDCDHIGWKSWKLIARAISATPWLFVATRGHGEILGRLQVGYGKSGMLGNKSGNISETRKDSGKVTIEAYRNSPTLFRTVSTRPPMASPSLRLGVCNLATSSQEQVKLRTSNLAGAFTGPIRIKAR